MNSPKKWGEIIIQQPLQVHKYVCTMYFIAPAILPLPLKSEKDHKDRGIGINSMHSPRLLWC